MKRSEIPSWRNISLYRRGAVTVLLAAVALAVNGCGAGGYAGGELTNLSSNTVTIDAGQAFRVDATTKGNLPVSWSLTGTACTGATCGSLDQPSGLSNTYTAPATVAQPMAVSMVAQVSGTKNAKTVAITVNRAPVINGDTPSGMVGTVYSATLVPSLGTGSLKMSLVSGSLPAGLSFDANTGKITGTPTTAGSVSFRVQAVDQSDVPYTVSVLRSITIADAVQTPPTGPTGPSTPALSISAGSPVNGTVAVPYSYTLTAAGGTSPYTWSMLSGSLPAGLSMLPNGTIAGLPLAAGTSTFVAQVQDASGAKVSATMQITITPARLALSLSVLPTGTVGVPYAATIGVGGGTAPYTCALAGGTMPSGLTLNANCSVSGTPTAPAISLLNVRVTDSGNPTQVTTGVVTLTVVPATLGLSISVLPNGTVNHPYSATIAVGGGTAPYTCSLTGGVLPAGLTLNSNCSVTGTPTTVTTSVLTVRAVDSGNPAQVTTGVVSLSILPINLGLSISVLPNGTVGVPYAATIAADGGVGPYTCTLVGGILPAGLTLNNNCSVSGTPTAPAIAALNVRITDSENPAQTTTGIVGLTIAPSALGISISVLPNGTVGVPYSATIGVGGGTAPFACTLTSGTLPAGLTLNNNCTVTGTPTAPWIAALTVHVTDSGSTPQATTGIVALTITPAPLNFSVSVLPNATMNAPYSATLSLTGGTAPYSCSLVSGVLPTGLTLNPNCTITGTPTQILNASALVIKGTDSSNPAQETTTATVLTVLPVNLGIGISVLPNGTVNVPYSSTVAVAGGVAPYTCQLTGGVMPAGLTLNNNCSISGTPTAPAIAALSIKATDSQNPAQNTTSVVALTISPAPLNLMVSALPVGTVGNVYSANITANGGVAPYTCSLVSGTVPAGLTLGADCSVTGTPTAAAIAALNVKVTDSATPAVNTTGIIALTVLPAPLNFTVSVLPNGVVNSPYSATLSLAGGTAPYTCSLANGVLPTGLTLNSNCTITGTPTQILNASVLTIHATDASTPALTTSTVVALTVTPINLGISISVLPGATVGVPYTSTVAVAGGIAPYTCSLVTGIMPAGLALNSDCSVSGTPTSAGLAALVIRATDSNNPAGTTTAAVALTVLPAISTLTVTGPANATLGVPYTGTIGVTGGTAPYTCTVASGTLPAGLTLASNCSLSGTPTATGASTLTILVSDAAPTPHTGDGIIVITVDPATPLAFTGTMNDATVGVAFNQTLAATGGVAPYTYAVTAGQLPAGISLNGGVLSGTPTAPGATSFTVTAMDSEGTPATVNLPLVMMVNYPATASDALMNGHYAFLFQGYDDVLVGVLAYQNATVGSFTADGTGKVAGGMLDRNSQLSTATGNTVENNNFLGTYTVGPDGRGSIAITALNSDGTTAGTGIMAIALKPVVAPATASAEGSLIAFDNNGLAAVKGSGSLLKQDTTAMAAGLNGSYAFGLSGDTPCLPSCSIGIVAGPVASVGQFTASNSVVSGTGDATVGSTNYPSSSLSGNYLAANANGRVQLSLNNTLLAGTPYPVDYAVYVVDANRAFVMSTDKHSAFILQAGTATLQTVSNFTAAAHLNAPFVGYENGPVNPGLVGTLLNNTLNLSAASIFQARGNGNGTCTTNLSDMGGLTGLVQALTSLGSSNNVVDALLGTYQTLGTGNCTVSSNGRAIIAYPAPSGLLAGLLTTLGLGGQQAAPRVAYLTGANSGYFLETGYATLGHMEAQAAPQGGTFTNAMLNGTYTYGTSPATSLVTINASGSFTADGAGNATETVDRNIGIGTINVLGLGVTGSSTYNVTDAVNGRYLLGASRVLYAISPGRYVLLEQDPLSTSPYTAILY